MPRVHTQKAGKDYPHIGVEKGTTYYWWKFRYGGKRMSATYPRGSQLTQSKYGEIYAAQEDFGDSLEADMALADVCSAAEEIASVAESVADEYEEADSAMGGHQGANYERAEGCRAYAEEVTNAIGEFEDLDKFGDDEEYPDEATAVEELVARVEGADLEQY